MEGEGGEERTEGKGKVGGEGRAGEESEGEGRRRVSGFLLSRPGNPNDRCTVKCTKSLLITV